MKIGIQISLNLKNKGGNEEYVHQLLNHLPMVDGYKNHQFFIFSKETLKWPFRWGWTQIRLSWEILKNRPDILFVPAHTFPIVYPVLKYKYGVHPRLIVAIQGLEFKVVPKMYSWFQRLKLNFLIKRNIKKADKIIVPSQNTKNDLIKYYQIDKSKIFVIHHGVGNPSEGQTSNYQLPNTKYLLYLGSGHKRKNIKGLIEAYKILKDKYQFKYNLIIAGSKNVGCPTSNIEGVVFAGCVDNEKKWELLKNADVFVFVSFAEGFGFPVLEAQKAGTPVVASNNSSFPEILGDSALLVNPYNPEEISEAIYKVLSSEQLRNELIRKGQENVQRFSWPKCAEETFKIICA